MDERRFQGVGAKATYDLTIRRGLATYVWSAQAATDVKRTVATAVPKRNTQSEQAFQQSIHILWSGWWKTTSPCAMDDP